MTSAGGDIADLKNEKQIPMSPKDGMTVEKVSLAVLAVFGVVGLAYFIATALEVLPIISASWALLASHTPSVARSHPPMPVYAVLVDVEDR